MDWDSASGVEWGWGWWLWVNGDGGFGTVGLAVSGCLVAAAKLGWVQALTLLPVLGTTTEDPSLVAGLMPHRVPVGCGPELSPGQLEPDMTAAVVLAPLGTHQPQGFTAQDSQGDAFAVQLPRERSQDRARVPMGMGGPWHIGSR